MLSFSRDLASFQEQLTAHTRAAWEEQPGPLALQNNQQWHFPGSITWSKPILRNGCSSLKAGVPHCVCQEPGRAEEMLAGGEANTGCGESWPESPTCSSISSSTGASSRVRSHTAHPAAGTSSWELLKMCQHTRSDPHGSGVKAGLLRDRRLI